MKFGLMKERLSEFKDIELVMPKMIGVNINVVEDGMTPDENAYKKAKQYYDATKLPTIAEDSGLYIDKFSQDEQPGLFVKRVNGIEGLSDDEVLKYYVDKINNYGGESLASYHTGVCLIDQDGKAHTKLIEETKFLLTTKNYQKQNISGGVLDSISYDLDSNKYFYERTLEDKKNHYKHLDTEYQDLIKEFL